MFIQDQYIHGHLICNFRSSHHFSPGGLGTDVPVHWDSRMIRTSGMFPDTPLGWPEVRRGDAALNAESGQTPGSSFCCSLAAGGFCLCLGDFQFCPRQIV